MGRSPAVFQSTLVAASTGYGIFYAKYAPAHFKGDIFSKDVTSFKMSHFA
jgi:hypothetical protein